MPRLSPPGRLPLGALRGWGNSVVPWVAKAIGDVIMQALGINVNQLERQTLPQQDDKLLKFSQLEAAEYYGLDLNKIPRRLKKKALCEI